MPYFNIFLEGALHRRVKSSAALAGQSMQQWITEALEAATAPKTSDAKVFNTTGRHTTTSVTGNSSEFVTTVDDRPLPRAEVVPTNPEPFRAAIGTPGPERSKK